MLPTNFIRVRSPRAIAAAGSFVAVVVVAACAADSTGPLSNATPQLSFSGDELHRRRSRHRSGRGGHRRHPHARISPTSVSRSRAPN